MKEIKYSAAKQCEKNSSSDSKTQAITELFKHVIIYF